MVEGALEEGALEEGGLGEGALGIGLCFPSCGKLVGFAISSKLEVA